jgi:hypothetical protein
MQVQLGAGGPSVVLWYVADARRRVGSIAVRRTNGSIGTFMSDRRSGSIAVDRGTPGYSWVSIALKPMEVSKNPEPFDAY